jgi:hypothetical protein
MTQSQFEVGPIGYDPDQYKPLEENKEPIQVINVELNGRLWTMPIAHYNENIEAGKTKFMTTKERLVMVTPEQYELLEGALKKLKKKG